MICDPERLSYYLDGELDPGEVEQLQDHLASCADCRDLLESFRRVEDSMRHLPDRPPPDQLRRAIYRSVEQRKRSRLRRLWASTVATPAVPLTAMAVLVAGGAAAWRLLPADGAPVMTAAFTVQELPDSLDGLRVELVFDRPIAPDSLGSGVRIEPPLALRQRVHENRVELIPEAPIAPGTSYRMVVSKVRDHRGNEQSAPVVLSLQAGPTALLVQESSPAGPSAAAPTPGPALPTTVAPTAPIGLAAAASPVTSRQLVALGRPSGPGSEPAELTRANPVLAGNPELAGRLGAALGAERPTLIGEQAFQGGAMVSRLDSSQVYALVRSNGQWLGFPNTWRPGEVLPPAGSRPPGTWEPLRGFGKVWREQPAVKLQLGWPVYDERSAIGRVQRFEHGSLLRTGFGIAYVLFDDGAWQTAPLPR